MTSQGGNFCRYLGMDPTIEFPVQKIVEKSTFNILSQIVDELLTFNTLLIFMDFFQGVTYFI